MTTEQKHKRDFDVDVLGASTCLLKRNKIEKCKRRMEWMVIIVEAARTQDIRTTVFNFINKTTATRSDEVYLYIMCATVNCTNAFCQRSEWHLMCIVSALTRAQ